MLMSDLWLPQHFHLLPFFAQRLLLFNLSRNTFKRDGFVFSLSTWPKLLSSKSKRFLFLPTQGFSIRNQ